MIEMQVILTAACNTAPFVTPPNLKFNGGGDQPIVIQVLRACTAVNNSVIKQLQPKLENLTTTAGLQPGVH